MLYLLLAILSSATISVLMRASEKYSRSGMAMLAMNYLMCCTLGAIHTGGTELFPQAEGMGLTVFLAAVSGMFYLLGFVLMQWNISRNGVTLTTTFMKLGIIVPTLISIAVFGESPRFTQIIGVVLAIGAIFLIQGRGEQGAGSILGLIGVMIAGGGGDVMSKVFDEIAPAALKNQFLLYIFFVALVLCVILCVVKRQKPAVADVLFGLAIGIPNYYSARFLLLSIGQIPAMVAYPSFSVGTIIVVSLAGVLCFHEKLNRRKVFALCVILAALALLNI